MRLLILAHGAAWDRRYQASALAASAASAGDRVDLAFFFAALDAWIHGHWDDLDPEPPIDPDRLAALGFPPLSSLLGSARGSGNLTLYACSASSRILGLDPTEVQTRVDMLCGWQTFHKLIGEADKVVTF